MSLPVGAVTSEVFLLHPHTIAPSARRASSVNSDERTRVSIRDSGLRGTAWGSGMPAREGCPPAD